MPIVILLMFVFVAGAFLVWAGALGFYKGLNDADLRFKKEKLKVYNEGWELGWSLGYTLGRIKGAKDGVA